MRENPTIIPPFSSGSTTPTSSAPPMTAGSESTTAGSMRLWRDSLSHRGHVNIACERRSERAKSKADVPELAAVKIQRPITSEASDDEHRVLEFRPRTLPHPLGRLGYKG